MASLFYAPGAIEHYVTFRNGISYYLGTAVTAPEVEERSFYLNVINDLGGRTAPMNKVGDRQQDVITTTLNRFDYGVYKVMVGAVGGVVGSQNNNTQGTLTFGVLDFELVLVYAAAVAGNTPAGFPIGRRYYTAQVIGNRESTVGTRVEEVTLVIECNELFNPTTRVFTMYTENSTDVLAGLPPVS